MEDLIWNLFRETGDPMGYLLYRAEKTRKTEKARRRFEEKNNAERRSTEEADGAPSAPV